jgi:hypothetical protein
MHWPDGKGTQAMTTKGTDFAFFLRGQIRGK